MIWTYPIYAFTVIFIFVMVVFKLSGESIKEHLKLLIVFFVFVAGLFLLFGHGAAIDRENTINRNKERVDFYQSHNYLHQNQIEVLLHIERLEAATEERKHKLRGLSKRFIDLSIFYNKNTQEYEEEILKLNLETINEANDITRRGKYG